MKKRKKNIIGVPEFPQQVKWLDNKKVLKQKSDIPFEPRIDNNRIELNTCEGCKKNLWVVFKHDGKFIAKIVKVLEKDQLSIAKKDIRLKELDWIPKEGEAVGFFVSKIKNILNIKRGRRSSLYWIQWK